MALLTLDGFDHYATADITKKYNSSTGATIASSSGRRSGGCLSCVSGFKTVKTIPATTSFVLGFAFNASAAPGGNRTLVVLGDAGTNQCNLILNNDLTISVARASNVLTSGTSVAAVTAGAWNYIEWKVTIADSISASSCIVKLNGVTIITVATGQDTKNTSNTTANQFWFGDTSSLTGTWLFDDFYLSDQSGGSPQNDFLGDCRIDTQFPNLDGSNSDWTCSTGSTHYTLVDESTPNTSDYVESSTAGQKDTWNFQDLSVVTGTIYGVQVCSAILKDDAGARTVANTVKSGGTNSDGATQGLSTSQVYYTDIWATDPNTSAAWTETNFNAAEFGVKLVA